MLNLPLIIYIFFLVGFILSALAVLYHLWFYQLNKKTAFFITLLFIVGGLILLAINLFLAAKVSWEEFNFYFYF